MHFTPVLYVFSLCSYTVLQQSLSDLYKQVEKIKMERIEMLNVLQEFINQTK
jgi:hypothetical protein